MGVFDKPLTDEKWLDLVGCNAHREVAREAVRKSLVLLKNDNKVLPLDKVLSSVIVAGAGAENIGLQCGGWSIEWMGRSGQTTAGTTLLSAIHGAVGGMIPLAYDANGDFKRDDKAEVGIVVFGEQPYAEGEGDRADLTLSANDIALVKRMREQCNQLVVIVFSGRPIVITDIVDDCDSIVAAWLPGTEGQGITDVLFGDYPFTGKLSYNWIRDMSQVPASALKASGEEPLWAFGYGLTT
jgi:beta-glucosidase